MKFQYLKSKNSHQIFYCSLHIYYFISEFLVIIFDQNIYIIIELDEVFYLLCMILLNFRHI